MSEIKSRKETMSFSAETIDHLTSSLITSLEEAQVDRKDIVRLRLSLEDILGIWLSDLGEGAKTTFK